MGRNAKRDGTRRVLFVGQWYPPEPVQIPVEGVDSLRDGGYGVTVLTGKPNYPEGVLHAGFDQRRTRTTENGVTVIRTAEYPSHSESAIGRMANYLSWMASAIPSAIREGHRSDAVFVYGSPITAMVPALASKLINRTPVVVQVQDFWPESVLGFSSASGVFRRVESLLYAVCNRMYRSADELIVISPGAKDRLVDRGISSDRITRIFNPSPDERYGPLPADTAEGAPLRLLYGGNIGPAQRLDVLIDAAAKHANVQLTISGRGMDREKLEAHARDIGAGNVEFRDPVFGDQYRELVGHHDVMVVSLGDEDVFEYTMPSKTQGILAFGRPILGICAGDLARVIEESGAGWASEPGDVEALSTLLGRIEALPRTDLPTMGLRGREYYETTMSRATFGELTVGVVDRAVRSAKRARRRGSSKPSLAAKRALDLAVSVPIFVATLPFQLAAAAAIRVTMGAPILFEQRRPGLDGEIFVMKKFRTMLTPEQAGPDADDAARLTRVGRWLRSTSIDELPTLWNVVKGDMSLVGPRPLLEQYLDRYTPEQARRHEVKPGITGLAQMVGRNGLSWEEKFTLDVEYVDGRSFLGDLKIIVGTIMPVLTRKGISSADSATMTEFMGSAPKEEPGT